MKIAKGQSAENPANSTAFWRGPKGTDHEAVVNETILRTQAQAEYTSGNYGHFGLNLRKYAHFTSPIRRYADLIGADRPDPRAFGFGSDGLPDISPRRNWPRSRRGFPPPNAAPWRPSAKPTTA